MKNNTPAPEYAAFAFRVLRHFAQYDDYDAIIWWVDRDAPTISIKVKCSDLFCWGCADAEEITPDNIELLESTYAEVFGLRYASPPEKRNNAWLCAGDLFCCRARKMRPQGAAYSKEYRDIWPLFDACGPERETGMGNPNPRPKE